jgi:hypothetical protein
MLRSLKELFGYSIHATDDVIGGVHDFLLDDRELKVRYLSSTRVPGSLAEKS